LIGGLISIVIFIMILLYAILLTRIMICKLCYHILDRKDTQKSVNVKIDDLSINTEEINLKYLPSNITFRGTEFSFAIKVVTSVDFMNDPSYFNLAIYQVVIGKSHL
jgi:hypothetical protein